MAEADSEIFLSECWVKRQVNDRPVEDFSRAILQASLFLLITAARRFAVERQEMA